MRMLKAAFLVALLTFFASQVTAADKVYFKAPVNFAGTGCPGNSVSTAAGENTDTLTAMFDRYDAAHPPKNNPISDAASKISRTSCNFAVPVHVPQGFQVSIATIDWMGYAKGKTELRRKYFFAGRPFVQPQVDHPVGNFILRDKGPLTWSKCGKDVQLRLNSSVKAGQEPSYIKIEKMTFHMKWRKCH